MRLHVPNLHDEGLWAVTGKIGRVLHPGQKELCDHDLCRSSLLEIRFGSRAVCVSQNTALVRTYSMRGGSTHGPIPPLASRKVRAVDLKFFLDGVPCCMRFESTHIAAMTQLSLRVAANNVIVQNARHPV